jgi:hypothetical protein
MRPSPAPGDARFAPPSVRNLTIEGIEMIRRKLSISLALGALIATVAMITPASAVTTTGTWVQYPNGATEYQAEVQQPINSANTSNWSAKSKGGIPVMYKLSSRTGPAVFESIGSDGFEGYMAGNFANDRAFMSFTPTSDLTFNTIETLKTDYQWVFGDCHGGSLRWQVRTSESQVLHIYYGSSPQFGNGGVDGCNPSLGGVNQTGTNMIGLSDLRYDTSAYPGGTWYDSYEHAKTLMGSLPVIRVSLVIDSGWQGLTHATDQQLTVSNTTVNDNVYQWNPGGSGAFAPTCDLPNAFIDVTNIDPYATGVINETTVYPASATDAGDQFRVIDCKYQYVLSIPSLPDGKGTYDVEIEIPDGYPVATVPNNEVRFDLK